MVMEDMSRSSPLELVRQCAAVSAHSLERSVAPHEWMLRICS